MVLIRRPDLRYQLGFSVQNGIVSAGGAIIPSYNANAASLLLMIIEEL